MKGTNLAAGGNGASGITSGIERILALVVLRLAGSGVDPRTDIRPCSIVQRFLLAPQQRSVGVLVQVGRDQVIREGAELFNAADRNVLDTALLASLK